MNDIPSVKQINKDQIEYRIFISTGFLEYSFLNFPLTIIIHGDKSTFEVSYKDSLKKGDLKQITYWFKDIGAIIGIQVSNFS